MSMDEAPRGFVSMREYLALQKRCDQLEDEVFALRDEATVGAWQHIRIRLNVSPQMAKILAALYCARTMLTTAETLSEAIGNPACANHSSVLVWKIRRTAEKRGWPSNLIESRNGMEGGRRMPDDAKAWLAEQVPELKSKGASHEPHSSTRR